MKRRKFLFVTGMLLCVLIGSAQKPPIDTAVIFGRPYVTENCTISSQGNYVMYTVHNQPKGSNTLVIQNPGTTWKMEFVDVSPLCFSADEKQVVFSRGDTIFFLSLVQKKIIHVSGVKSYKQPKETGIWLAYNLKNDPKQLVLYNLLTDERIGFPFVEESSFSKNGEVLLLKRTSIPNGQPEISLDWITTSNGKSRTIWRSKEPSTVSTKFDLSEEKLVFMVKALSGNSIWYYQNGMDNAIEKVTDKTAGIAQSFKIANDNPNFSISGKYIFFKLQRPLEKISSKADAVQIDIWSYKDITLFHEQPKTVSSTAYTATIAVEGNRVIQIEQEGEQIVRSPKQSVERINSDYLVVGKSHGRDFWWNSNKSFAYYLVSLADGSRKLVRDRFTFDFFYSPAGRFIIYFDGEQDDFYSYETATGITRNITKVVSERFISEYDRYVPGRTFPLSLEQVAGWIKDDAAVLVYDNYDVWKIDPSGRSVPVNLTNGYGKKNSIKFKVVFEMDKDFCFEEYEANEPILLSGFNTKTKYNGFFVKKPIGTGDPDILTMGPYTYCIIGLQVANSDGYDTGMKPKKASGSNTWLIKRSTTTEAPNLFVTTDFKNYKQVSNIQFHKNYNWLTSELVTYKQLDGTTSQGVLYKPENFDPKKKYPVLFSYYETFSHIMYQFPTPGLNVGRIDIPWYVSRGYLVFTPDIHYSIASVSGKLVGDHAVNSVLGAARHLSKLPYVNAKAMGIQGHSFGGGETNYLVTHINIFAAACAAAATVSDEISAYLSVHRPNGVVGGDFRLSHAETGHDMIGATLWERPDLFIKASPIFRADKVTTPLLLMHNQGDGATDWGQSIEMYMALRRLQKPCWLLQYDKEDHIIIDDKNAYDFTIRTQQFFDHYLKGEPAPKWMTGNSFAKFKGVDNLYEPDPTGSCGKDCKVCKSVNNTTSLK